MKIALPPYFSGVLKVVVTAGLFYLLARQLDWPAVWDILKNVNPWYLVLNLVLMALSTVLSGIRWGLVATGVGIKKPALFYQKHIWIGAFFNQVLPGGIGGDGMRILALKGYLNKGAVSSILLERGAGLVMLLVFIAFLLPVSNYVLRDSPIATGLAVLAFGGLLCGFLYGLLGDKLPLQKLPGLGSMLKKMPEHMRHVLVLNRQLALGIWALSIIIQFLGVLHFYFTAQALGLNIDLVLCMALVPPVFLLLLVPISFAGWGLREGAVIGLFTAASLLEPTTAAVLSILYGLQMIVAALPGAAVFCWKSRS